MNKYSYEGPVLRFGVPVTNSWSGSTYAPTERKAISNLAYRFKKANNLEPRSNITLPGRLTLIKERDNL